jgi:hypothetical protein
MHEASITKYIFRGSDRCEQQTNIFKKKGSRLGSSVSFPKASVGVRRRRAGWTEAIDKGRPGWMAGKLELG